MRWVLHTGEKTSFSRFMFLKTSVNKGVIRLLVLAMLLMTGGCNQFVYLPKSAKQKYFARPHIQFMMAVVEFREDTGGWPGSQYELEHHRPKNPRIINDFQYRNLHFQQKKDGKLFVFFDEYKKELYLDVPGKTDLNRFHGLICFFKTGDKFAWKVKMR